MRLPLPRVYSSFNSFFPSQRRSISSHFQMSEEFLTAKAEGKSIVALESTVITHGLPHPINLSTARSLERIIREEGSIPATIAVLNGKIKIGLSDEELERISQDKEAKKVSRRDIAYVVTQGVTGGTTVAATMWAAHQAGIRVFSTGGIGGVHRGAEETFDISADLIELSRTPVTVVCAGIKSILDVGKTIEMLETYGVNTLVYSNQNVFPGFFTSKTAFKGQMNSTSIEEIATIINTSYSLGLPSGTLLTVPIPQEVETEAKPVEEAIQKALKEAEEKGVNGQRMTPFLLDRVAKITKGKSMETNISLLENNARVAGRLARELQKKKSVVRSVKREKKKKMNPRVVVIGASILDFEAITNEQLKEDGGSYAGRVVQRMGGVGRNHAEGMGRMECDTLLLSAVGRDTHGQYIEEKTRQFVDTSRLLHLSNVPTAVYMSLNQKGNVLYGISCVEDTVRKISPQYISSNEDVISSADCLVLDGNLPIPTISTALELAKFHKRKVWYEPTDIAKATKFLQSSSSSSVSFTSPNTREFISILKHCGININESAVSSPTALCDFLRKTPFPQELSSLEFILVTMAAKGSLMINRRNDEEFNTGHWGHSLFIPPPSPNQIISVSGAGDTMNSALLSSLLHGQSLPSSIHFSLQAASLTLLSTDAVAPELTQMEKPWNTN